MGLHRLLVPLVYFVFSFKEFESDKARFAAFSKRHHEPCFFAGDDHLLAAKQFTDGNKTV